MKTMITRNFLPFLLIFLVLIISGCEYEAPLAEKQDLKLDSALFGTWEMTNQTNEKEKLIISKLSDSEYSIRHFSISGVESFLRGYPIKIENIFCVQLIITDEKFVPVNDAQKYIVMTYEISADSLITKILNPDLISNELKKSVELKSAFAQNKENKNLFIEPGTFKKLNTSEDAEIELRNAANVGNLLKIKSLITNGVDVNAKNSEGFTALMIASYKGNLQITQALIAAGANINAKNRKGVTPLIFAVDSGFLPIVQILIIKGADLNAKDSDNDTALILALLKGYLPIVQMLITKGADLEVKDKDGNTPLIIAAAKGFLPIIQSLLRKGVNLNVKNNKGFTALMFGTRKNTQLILQALLLQGADVNIKNNEGETALMAAIRVENLLAVKALIMKKADVNARDNKGMTVLMFAAANESLPILQFLLTKGANVNDFNKDGISPLMFAVLNDKPEMVKLLISKGANVNAEDNDGYSALDYAVLEKNNTIIEILKAELNKPCPQNRSSEHTFKLNDRVNTGITIKRGDKLTFSASGTISFGFYAGSGGPDGISGFRDYNFIRGDIQHGVFVAKINTNDGWYIIGKGKTIFADNDGILLLDVNDKDASNNTGYFDVKLNICKAN